MKLHIGYFCCALCHLATSHAAAENPFKISGIAVLGATYSSERNADFNSGIDHPNGAGLTRANDFLGDSRVAVQIEGKFGAQFSAMLQVTSEHRYDNSFMPHLTAAALKWQATPNVALRMGRQPFLIFLVPEEKLPWVRATTEIYQSGLLNLYDGAELSAQTQWGTTTLLAQSYVGAVAYPIPGGINIQLNQITGINLLAYHGNHILRASHIRGRLTLHGPDSDHAFALLRTLPNGNALADRYQVQNTLTQHRGLAYCYQNSTGYFLAEWSQFSAGDSFIANSTQGHLTAGLHFNQFTPFITLAGKQANKISTDPNPILNALFAGRNVGQKSAVIGLRWDFAKNTDFKVQYDHVINSTGSIGALSNQQANFQTGGRYRLLSAALEYAF